MEPLFDPGPPNVPPPDPEAELSATQKLTLRRRRMLEQGIHPATKARLLDPVDQAGASCGMCVHARQIDHHRRTYWKCDLVPHTNGAATDIRVSWPACTRYEAHPDG
jgi:hypothetical protein